MLVIDRSDILFIESQDKEKLDKEPKFTKVTYSDSGLYECLVTMDGLSRSASFELAVEGKSKKETERCVICFVSFNDIKQCV